MLGYQNNNYIEL